MTVSDWIKSWFCPPVNWFINAEYWSSYCVTTTWFIWKTRCAAIFQNRQPSSTTVAQTIDLHLQKLQVQLLPLQTTNCRLQTAASSHIQNMTGQSNTVTGNSIWIPPESGIFKINVDISFVNVDFPIAIGFLVRDSIGTFIHAGTDMGNAGTSEEAECVGILIAVCEGIKLKLKKVELETDHKGVATFLAGKPASLSWTSVNILEEVKNLCFFYESLSFKFCNRTGNTAAHILASYRDKSLLGPLSYHSPPSWLLSQLDLDRLFCNLANI